MSNTPQSSSEQDAIASASEPNESYFPDVVAILYKRRWIVVSTFVVAATAHPAKFETVVEPLIAQKVEPPPKLAELLERPSHAEPLAARTEALLERLPVP